MATVSDIQARQVNSTLEPVVERVFDETLACSTWRTYRSAQSDYLAFCQSVLAPPIPASEDLLILYTTQLSTRLAHSSIRMYLSAVRNLHVMSGAGDPMVGYLKFMKGIKRLKARPTDTRLPITPFVGSGEYLTVNLTTEITSCSGQPAV